MRAGQRCILLLSLGREIFLLYLVLRLYSAEGSGVSTLLTAILPVEINGTSKKLELDDAYSFKFFLCCKQSYSINKPGETSPQYKPGGWEQKCMAFALIKCSPDFILCDRPDPEIFFFGQIVKKLYPLSLSPIKTAKPYLDQFLSL